MKHRLALVAVVIMCGSLVTACGDGTKAYCDDLKSAKQDFSTLDNADMGNFDQAIETMHELADEAPDEVADDWKVVDDSLSKFQSALKDAGINTDDLEKMSNGQMPEGVDQQKLMQLMDDMQSVLDKRFTDATETITKHAKDECNVTLGSS